MAKLKIEGLLEELEAEFKKAISSTLRVHFDPEQYTAVSYTHLTLPTTPYV